MKSSRISRVLLALTFAVGQWFAVAHATQHELKAGDKLVVCEICAVSHASAAPPLAATLAIPHLRNIEPPAARIAAAPQRKPLYRPPTRGPPALSA